jgi:hypothetical protein
VRRTLPGACIAAVALCCLALGVTAESSAHAALTRAPTAAERSAAAAAAVASRWRSWPAGRIFPAGLGYLTSLQTTETARRAGISAGSGCRSAIVAVAGRQALQDGCRAALRATYADQLQGVVYTIGVFAFASPRGAAAFLRALAADPPGGPAGSHAAGSRAAGSRPAGSRAAGSRAAGSRPAARFHARGADSVLATEKSPWYGLRALAVPGTAGARFTNAARQVMTGRQQGPYVALVVAGYADGRPAAAAGRLRYVIFRPARQLAAEVLGPLSAPPAVTCARPEWLC